MGSEPRVQRGLEGRSPMPMLMIMNAQTARTLFAYNRWANRLILEAAGELPAEDLDRDLKGSFGSIKGMLRHLLWGERAWLSFWTEGVFSSALAPEDYPDLPSIVAGWTALEREQDAFALGLTDARLAADCSVAENDYALAELIQHSMNHATHHRGQVILMLRQLGRTPPGTGFRQFLTANRESLAHV
jgi:uncharacterized damage-inducible protein DinB